MQWNQNTPTPSVNVVYPQSQNVISPSACPSATYSFTADFRPPNQSDPLITATSTFKPLIQNSQKPNNYIFQKQPNFNSQKVLSQNLKRSPSKVYMGEGQKILEQSMSPGYIMNHQGQMHHPEYGYTTCVSASGKVPVSMLYNTLLSISWST